jgi:tol-pal system protein YbgF
MLSKYSVIRKIATSLLLKFLLGSVIFVSFCAVSSAQSTNERLSAIEKQLSAIQRQVFTPGSRFQSSGNNDNNTSEFSSGPSGSASGLMGDINIRISELETQLRQMTGQLEEANFKVNSLTNKLELMEKDYEFRFNNMEKAPALNSELSPETNFGNNMPTVVPTMDVPSGDVVGSNGSPLPIGTPKEQYDYAYSLVSKSQYEEAERSLTEFLNLNPTDDLAGNAQYWLGQTHYARGNYTEAAKSFLEGMNKYPNSQKAPAFLLKVGMSLNELGEKTDACEVYRELESRFPNSDENTRMRSAEERKAGCSR